MNQEMNSLQQRRLKSILSLVLVILLFIGSVILTKMDLWDAIKSFPEAFAWIAKNFMPEAKSFEQLPKILEKLYETILMAIASVTLASIFAFILALFGSQVTQLPGKAGKFLGILSRLIASFFRNVPDVVWSMLFLFSFGQSLMTGFLALFFVTFGTLTRAFIESIDESAGESIEALRSTGASYLQVVGQSIIPSAIGQIISWIMYMIETNIRSATLIGILTGSGIGNQFNIYYRSFRYHDAGLVVLTILITVIVIETLSNFIRRSIL